MRFIVTILIITGGVGLALAGLMAAGMVGIILAVCRVCR